MEGEYEEEEREEDGDRTCAPSRSHGGPPTKMRRMCSGPEEEEEEKEWEEEEVEKEEEDVSAVSQNMTPCLSTLIREMSMIGWAGPRTSGGDSPASQFSAIKRRVIERLIRTSDLGDSQEF